VAQRRQGLDGSGAVMVFVWTEQLRIGIVSERRNGQFWMGQRFRDYV